MEKKFNRFSVPLGLLDYVNPILYTVTMVTIIRNMHDVIGTPYNTLLKAGAILSIFFGFVIPTGKVIVGLGLIKFVMPVILVALVNTGILISGLVLFRYVLNVNVIIMAVLLVLIAAFLISVYLKSRKANTIAVLTGAVGYLLVYTSLIIMSVKKGIALPVILYGLAILLFMMLCGIGIKADLKNPKVHWVIEISNVLCQLFVALATLRLFS